MNKRLKNLIKQFPLLFLDPIAYEKLRFFIANKYFLNLKNPSTFNEKISHRKLFDRNPRFTTIADKYAVRQFVQSRISSKFLPKLYFYGDAQEVDFNEFPIEFVAKAINASGREYILFVDNKVKFDDETLRNNLMKLPVHNYGKVTNEWWYKDIPPKIIIEEFLHELQYEAPVDYKFYVFHGTATYIHLTYHQNGIEYKSFYDRNWQMLNIVKKNNPQGKLIDKPHQLPELIKIAETLGKSFDFIRVDLYNINDERILFSELTLAPAAGYNAFHPRKWDFIFGQMWKYP